MSLTRLLPYQYKPIVTKRLKTESRKFHCKVLSNSHLFALAIALLIIMSQTQYQQSFTISEVRLIGMS